MSTPMLANPLIASPTRRTPSQVGIVGAGTIGPDIGYYLKSALPDLKLQLVDVDERALERALQRLRGYAAKGVEKGRLKQEQADALMANIQTTLDYEALAPCDWVIEAATENLQLKRDIFTRLEAILRSDALITSNTSSLPAERLFGHLQQPERATVTHFFAPAWRNPAVEVVRWEALSPEVLSHLRWLFCSTGKVPLVTADALCFMLDRVFDNWCNEAALLLDEASAAEVDTVASEFVHAGPFFVLNLARGNPIISETNALQAAEEGPHYQPASIFTSVDTWKTVRPGQRVEVRPEVARRVRDRLLGVLFSQALDIVDRGIGDPADLDLGCCLALGFKAGPLDLMRRLGDGEAGGILSRFARERPGMPTPQRALSRYQGFRRHVLVDDVYGVSVLTLRRPGALNALHDGVTDELLEAITEREDDPEVKGFVLTGYGTKAFCAGADVGRFPELLGKPEEAAGYARHCSRLLVHLDRCTKPVVAALNGMALGGGLELALRCHDIVAVRGAVLQLPEITLGIAPGAGGMVVPYRRWPDAAEVFHDMLRLGRKLSAAEAHGLGVVSELTDDVPGLIRLAVERVRAMADRFEPIPEGPVHLAEPSPVDAQAGPGRPLSAEVIGIIEQAVLAAAVAPTLQEALEVGYAAFGKSACTAAAKEGVSAFLERRPPDFATTG